MVFLGSRSDCADAVRYDSAAVEQMKDGRQGLETYRRWWSAFRARWLATATTFKSWTAQTKAYLKAGEARCRSEVRA